MKYFLIIFILLFFNSVMTVFAQDQCAVALSEAEAKYNQGRLYEVSGILEPCLSNGFTKEEKVRAYRLLTLTYLFLDYYQEADDSYLKLLQLSPEFEPNEELDPMEIIIHASKFTTKPKYYLTLAKGGLSFSHANVLRDYSLSQSSAGTSAYKSMTGFHLGLGAEMVLFQNLHLSGELFLSQRKLHMRDTHWDFYSTNLDISHTEVELPIMLKYNFFRGKINPFVSGGVSPEFLLQSNINNIDGSYRQPSDTEGIPDESFPVQPRPKIATTMMKHRFNYSLLLGGGVNYKIGLNYLVFEARYSNGMLNVTDEEMRWREDFNEGRDLKFPTGHVDDDFKINNLSFFIGFVKPLYKPRKIK